MNKSVYSAPIFVSVNFKMGRMSHINCLPLRLRLHLSNQVAISPGPFLVTRSRRILFSIFPFCLFFWDLLLRMRLKNRDHKSVKIKGERLI